MVPSVVIHFMGKGKQKASKVKIGKGIEGSRGYFERDLWGNLRRADIGAETEGLGRSSHGESQRK